jgi:carboxypeptidase Q
MKRALWLIGLCVVPHVLHAQLDIEPHRAPASRLIQAALRDSAAWKRLGLLVDGFGHRMTGSSSLEQALDWIVAEMRRDGFENVRKEPVMVPRWVRGEESAELVRPRPMKLHMLGLGRSVGTPAQGISAPVLVVRSFAELRSRATEARGKIVLFNVPFDTTIHPGTAYGRVRTRRMPSARWPHWCAR